MWSLLLHNTLPAPDMWAAEQDWLLITCFNFSAVQHQPAAVSQTGYLHTRIQMRWKVVFWMFSHSFPFSCQSGQLFQQRQALRAASALHQKMGCWSYLELLRFCQAAHLRCCSLRLLCRSLSFVLVLMRRTRMINSVKSFSVDVITVKSLTEVREQRWAGLK